MQGEMKEPGAMMAEHHTMSWWVHPVNMVLGLWLASSPWTLGYTSEAMRWSDAITGVVVFALAALAIRRPWAGYANAFTGLWLLFAPLVFWTPDAAAYVNDTLVGALVIAFTLLIPHGMPMEGPDVPPGWTYNPSSWPQRAPIIAFGLIGFLISRYLAAYQLGHIQTAWDPFFDDGTVRVLDSEVSKAWPISDAGLGAVAYMIEVLMGFMGDKRRWRTMPWMVAFFGILVIPLGVTSIVLVILQPLMVGAWCTLCLVTAVAMLAMIPLTLDEVFAMIQFMQLSKRQGKSLWRTFWLGGNLPEDARPAPDARGDAWTPSGMTWGVTLPWSLVVSMAIGVWLMFAPAVFGTTGAAADSDHLVGALVVTVAAIATAEVGRPFRYVNLLLGAWLVIGSWLIGGASVGASVNDTLAGLAIVGLSLPLGAIRERYGPADRAAAWGPLRSRHPHLPTRPQVVVLTGASAGVGRAIARMLGQRGCAVALIARGRDGLEAAAREVEEAGGRALVLPLDVSDADAVEAAAQRVEDELGPIDAWINNAMVSVFSPIKLMAADEFRRVTEVTYLGYVHGTLSALRRMLPRDRGVIVQVGSALAYRGIPLQSAYCGAKHAVEGFTDSLRCELVHDGSRVSVTMVQLPAMNTPQFTWSRSRMPRKPQPVPPIYQPEVGAAAVVRALLETPREVYVAPPTWVAIIGNKLVPGLYDRILARTAYDDQMTREPAGPRPDNLLAPIPGDRGAHGPFDARALERPSQALFRTIAGWIWGLLVTVGAELRDFLRKEHHA